MTGRFVTLRWFGYLWLHMLVGVMTFNCILWAFTPPDTRWPYITSAAVGGATFLWLYAIRNRHVNVTIERRKEARNEA